MQCLNKVSWSLWRKQLKLTGGFKYSFKASRETGQKLHPHMTQVWQSTSRVEMGREGEGERGRGREVERGRGEREER